MEKINPEYLRIDENRNLYRKLDNGEIVLMNQTDLNQVQSKISEYGFGFFEYKAEEFRYAYLLEPFIPNKKYSIIRSQSSSNCFGCGLENKIGFGLNFIIDIADNISYAWITLSREYEGWENVVHGGFISLMMDEAMAKCIASKGIVAVTANLQVSFRKPAFVGRKLELIGRINNQNGKKYECIGEVLDFETRDVLATATALFIEINITK